MKHRFLLVALGSLALAGCYETDQPLLVDTGERAPLAGRFQCGSGAGRLTQYSEDTLQEVPSPNGTRVSYYYVNEEFGQVQFKRIGGNLYLAQILDQPTLGDVKVLYLFFEFLPDGFVVLFADPKHEYAKSLAKSHRITMTTSKSEGFVGTLAGAPADILAFLQDYDRSQLDQLDKCVRKGS